MSKFLVGIGGAGAIAVILVPALQSWLQAYLESHPKFAPLVGFLALVFAGFTPSASKKVGQAVVAKDVENAPNPKKEQASVTRQTQEAVIVAAEKKDA